MEAAFQQLGAALQKTLSNSKEERGQGEAALKGMMVAPGFGAVTLQFLTLDMVSPVVKKGAAVAFKNMVKEHWTTSISDGDKVQIKGVIVPFLLSGPPPALQSLLAEALTIIAQHDFPAQWTNLVQELVAQAKTQDQKQLNGVMRVAHSVFKRYRHVSASTDVLRELKFILEQFQQPLLAIYLNTWQLLQGQTDPAKVALLMDTLNVCTKLFYDLTFVDLPEYFEDTLKQWMMGFLHSIQFRTQISSVLGDDDKAGLLHKLQKNVCMALALFSTKYDEEFSQFLQGFVHGVWQLLTEALSTNHAKYEHIVAHGVAFLTAVANGAHHALFSNMDILKSICEKIVIPCMMLRDDDVELFEDDPLEYVRQDIEGSDLDTRRRSAKELVKGLRKNYEKLVTEIFGSYIQILLKQYESNPKANWKAKDVAVFLLTALTVSTFRVATGANSVNSMVPLLPFFAQNVMPDLRNTQPAHAILQADALKFVITFRSQIPASEYGVLIPALVGLLKSPVVVVHTYAANALDHMLTIKDKSETGAGFTHRITKESLEPMLRDLLGALFGVFQANGQKPNSYVMRAIMRVLSKAKEKIAPLVSVVLEALSNLLRTVILNPQSPVFNHYLFESIGAMIGCASAVGGAAAVTSLQVALLPMFQTILGQDLAEFTGYVFQLLCQLLGEHQEVPEVYWGLFPSLLAPLLWSRPGNVPALVRLLGQYLSKGAAKIAASDQWMVAFLGVWQHLNSVVKHDGATFELLVSFTDFMPLPVSDKYLPRVLQLVFVRLSNPKMKTPRYINGFVTWLLSFAARHGGSAIVQRCNSVQQGIWVNCLGLIAQSMNKPRSPADKKRCALGAVRLLTATDEMLADSCVASWPQVLSALMALFELPEEEDEAGLVDDSEISGGAVYTPLYHAGSTVEKDPFANVNEKAELAKGLAALNQRTQGKALALVRQIPPEAAQKLQSYFQQYGISL